MNGFVAFAWLAVLGLLGGCAVGKGGSGAQSAEPPMSQQTATSNARQRAKTHVELGAL